MQSNKVVEYLDVHAIEVLDFYRNRIKILVTFVMVSGY